MSNYIIISPARNEASYIEQTIKSVVSQTINPLQYIIADNGSTDDTFQIVESYTKQYDYIRFINVDTSQVRSDVAKSVAFNAAYRSIIGLEFKYLGNLDADVTFEGNYFEKLIERMESNSKLGVTGGWILEESNKGFKSRFCNRIDHVPGAVQFFRREAFEKISGFDENLECSADTIAEVKIINNGWEVESFPDIPVYHHRTTGSANRSLVVSRFYKGKHDYIIGYHPIYEFGKFIYRLLEKPYLIGSFMHYLGYLSAAVNLGHNKSVSNDIVSILRKEQIKKIRKYLIFWQ